MANSPEQEGNCADFSQKKSGRDSHRIILHLDMDSFYASVEMHENAALKGKPVIIGADPQQGTGRGVVSTCSYEARAFGVRSAMPISQAYVLCPQAIYLSPHFPRYSKASEAIMAILRCHNFPFQQVSIDEAFLDISSLGGFSLAIDWAARIKNEIWAQLGLTCSIGIAPTKVVAKIASDVNKPDGITVVEPENLFSFLAPMSVRKIPGVGSKSETVLFEMGIRTIRDLAEYDTQELISQFGHSVLALKAITDGTDNDRVEGRDSVRSVSREITFSEDTQDEQVIVATIEALAQDVSRSLADESLRCMTVTIKVRFTGFTTRTKTRRLPHYTNDPKTIRSTAHSLLREMFDGQKIRLLGIRLSSFEKQDARQTVLPV